MQAEKTELTGETTRIKAVEGCRQHARHASIESAAKDRNEEERWRPTGVQR
jgi:hypothetical protein